MDVAATLLSGVTVFGMNSYARKFTFSSEFPHDFEVAHQSDRVPCSQPDWLFLVRVLTANQYGCRRTAQRSIRAGGRDFGFVLCYNWQGPM